MQKNPKHIPAQWAKNVWLSEDPEGRNFGLGIVEDHDPPHSFSRSFFGIL